MIVVTGSARTGTSMIMQTLVKLGYKPVSPKFSNVHDNIRGYNPKGFYDIEDINDIEKLTDESGEVVKIFGSCLDRINFEIVDKLIMVLKSAKEAVASSIPVFKAMGEDVEGQELDIYMGNYKLILDFIDQNPSIPVLGIEYSMMVEDPENIIKEIARFLGCNTNPIEAINNINTEELCPH